MKFIQVIEVGRGARELNRYPAIVSDPLLLLALEVEQYWDAGAIVSPVPGEDFSYTILRKPCPVGGKRNIKVRVIDVETEADTQEIEVWEYAK